MTFVLLFFPDIGNRITELSKAVGRLNNDMKVVHHLLINEGRTTGDVSSKDGSSFLGKYIIGAKNNFRGFNSGQDDKNASVKAVVYHDSGDIKREKAESETKQIKENELKHSEGTDCDVVKMEEGRAQEHKEENVNTDNKAKEVLAVEISHGVKAEHIKGEEKEMSDGKSVTEEGDNQTEQNKPETHTKQLVNRFKDQRTEPRWMTGRKFEPNVPENSGAKETNVKPGAKKGASSPTGSSSSQDTGFGSQEGEGLCGSS